MKGRVILQHPRPIKAIDTKAMFEALEAGAEELLNKKHGSKCTNEVQKRGGKAVAKKPFFIAHGKIYPTLHKFLSDLLFNAEPRIIEIDTARFDLDDSLHKLHN